MQVEPTSTCENRILLMEYQAGENAEHRKYRIKAMKSSAHSAIGSCCSPALAKANDLYR